MTKNQVKEVAEAVASTVEVEDEEDFQSDVVYELINRDFFSLFPITTGVLDPSEQLETSLSWIQSHNYILDDSEDADEEAPYTFDDEGYAQHLEQALAHMYGNLNHIFQLLFLMVAGRFAPANATYLDDYPQEWKDATKQMNHDIIMKLLIRGAMSINAEELPGALKIYPTPSSIDDLIAVHDALPPQIKTDVMDIIEKAMVHVYENNNYTSNGI